MKKTPRLRESTLSSALFDNQHTPMLLIEPETGAIVDANPAACRFYGNSREKFTTLTFADLNPLPAEDVFPNTCRIGHGEGDYRCIPHRLADGSLREVEVRSGLVELDGRPLLFAVIIDGGERHSSEAQVVRLNLELQKRLEELQTIFDTVPIGLAIADDPHGRHIRGNPENERMLGIRPGGEMSFRAEMLPPFRVREHGRDLAVDELPMQRAVRGEKVSGQTMEVLREDGQALTLYCCAAPLLDPDGAPRGAVGAFLDVSELKRVELALRESEQKLRETHDLLEAVTAGTEVIISVLDKEYRYRFFNRAYQEEMRRLTGTEIQIGTSLLEALSAMPTQQKVAQQHWDRTLRGEESTTYTVEFGESDRYRRIYNVRHVPLRNADGQVVGAGEVAFDVTDQVRAQEELRESQQRYATLAEASFEGITLTEQGRIVDVNRQLAELLGYGREELIGREVAEFIVPEDRETVLANIIANRESKVEHQLVRGNGSRRIVETHGRSIEFHGRPMRLTVIRDITEHRQLEEALRHSRDELEQRVLERTAELARTVSVLQNEIIERISAEEKLGKALQEARDLYNLAPCGYHSLDAEGTFVRINDTELEWLGYRREEVEGKMNIRQLMSPGSQLVFTANFPNFKENGYVRDLEFELVRKDGTILPVLLSATAIKGPDGEFLMSRSTMFDITERKLAEQKLREQERLLLQQSRLAAMGEMIGNIAHQWRQPLNRLGLIIQRLPLLQESGELTRECLEENTSDAMQLVFHMSRTIDDFRNFFRPDKEKVTFHVNQVVSQTVNLVAPSFKEQRISISVTVADDPLLEGFPNEFAQVLLNILMNARDALVERQVANPLITVRSYREEGRTVVVIADNGGGIAPEILDRVFEPYFTTKGPDKGTGVGLYMAKSIIETNMNGRLLARNLGACAEFRIEV